MMIQFLLFSLGVVVSAAARSFSEKRWRPGGPLKPLTSSKDLHDCSDRNSLGQSPT